MEYEDFFEMTRSILGYIKEHPGRVIVSNDDPPNLTFGFSLRDLDPFLLNRPTWRITTRNFKTSISQERVSNNLRDTLQHSFQTSLGRARVAELLTSGCNPVAGVVPEYVV